MTEKAILRVHGHGNMEVEWIYEYLRDFEYCYNSINTFDSMLGKKQRSGDISTAPVILGLPPLASAEQELIAPHMLHLRRNQKYVVGISERLVIRGVSLQSPGFWEFVGKLNPLEVIRQYLNDRHERKKDNSYRNSAEERRLRYENELLKIDVIQKKWNLAESMGFSKDEIEPLIAELVAHPLEKLDGHQDRNVIEYAEKVEAGYIEVGDGYDQSGSSEETEEAPA